MTAKVIFLVLAWLLCGLFFPLPVLGAIELSFSTPPSQVVSDQAFTLQVTLSGASSSSEYYLRGVFYKEGSTQYFGNTMNQQGNWHAQASQHQQFYHVVGNGTSEVQFQADADTSLYQGPGQYQFKIGRYTPGGSLTWSTQVSSIEITPPASTPQPSPTPLTQPSPTPQGIVASPSASPSVTPIPTAPPPISNGITISEVSPCPSSGEKEWVELFNQHLMSVELTNWALQDAANNKHVFQITLPAQALATVEIPLNMLNNTGDSVSLLNGNNTIIDTMGYEACETGQTLIKVGGSWQVTTRPTKNQDNILPSPTAESQTPTPAPSASASPKPTTKPSATLSISSTPDASPPTTSAAKITTPSIFTASISGLVLGEQISPHNMQNSSRSPSATDSSSSQSNTNLSTPQSRLLPLGSLILGGAVFIILGGYFLWGWYNKQ